jgi:hypothetical protein
MAANDAGHDWRPVWDRLRGGDQGSEPAALVVAAPEEVNRQPAMPSEYSISEAPMEEYDIVELSEFDRPLARGRVAFGDGFAVLGPVLPVKEAQVAPEHEAMVLAAAAEQAYIEGAETLYAPVPEDAVQRYERLGWKRVDGR